MSSESKLENIRPSLAHLLAAAVLKKYPKAKLGIGPIIENGFYYNFDLPEALTPEDLEDFTKEMRKMINAKLPFSAEEVTTAVATKRMKGQKYKLELIKDFSKEDQKLTIYKTGDVFEDLC